MSEKKIETVAVLGASPKVERYSNKACLLLQQHNHKVIPINPAKPVIDGVQCVAHLDDISEPVDTLTMYVGPAISVKLTDNILKLSPKRVIFNQGTENETLEKELMSAGIQTIQACTLVMLNTGQF